MPNTEVLAKEIVIQFDGTTVAYTTDFTLSVNGEQIDVTTLDGDGWKKFLKGDLDWSLSFSGLVTRGTITGEDYSGLLNYLKTSDEPVTLIYSDGDPATPGTIYETGLAFVSRLEASGSNSDKVTYNGEFRGTGPLDTVTTP